MRPISNGASGARAFRAGAAEVARHFVEAAGAGYGDRAVACLCRAGEGATSVFAYPEAAQCYQTAVEILAADPRSDERRGELLVAMGDAFQRSGSLGAASRAYLAAAEIGRRCAAHSLRARATLGLGRNLHSLDVDERLIGLLEEVMQGRFADVEPILRGYVESNPEREASRAALAHLYLHACDLDAARHHFELLAERGFAGIPRDGVWTMALAYLVEVCAALDDRRRASVLYEMISPHADRIIGTGASLVSYGHGRRYMALLEQTLRRWDDAMESFARAIEAHERMRARPWLAYSLVDRGGMLLRRSATSRARRTTTRQAVDDLMRARAIAADLGMRGIESRIVCLEQVASRAL